MCIRDRSWRDWLNREFEAANFRDGAISSPIVLTPLNAVCLRRFEAAVLIGGDARQLAPASTGEFFNQSVRRELGLRTRANAARELRRDLELLLALSLIHISMCISTRISPSMVSPVWRLTRRNWL